jgi:hypothetical protein
MKVVYLALLFFILGVTHSQAYYPKDKTLASAIEIEVRKLVDPAYRTEDKASRSCKLLNQSLTAVCTTVVNFDGGNGYEIFVLFFNKPMSSSDSWVFLGVDTLDQHWRVVNLQTASFTKSNAVRIAYKICDINAPCVKPSTEWYLYTFSPLNHLEKLTTPRMTVTTER